jgi:hypothetical protein
MIQMVRSKGLVTMSSCSDMEIALTFMYFQCAEYSTGIPISHLSAEFRHQSFMEPNLAIILASTYFDRNRRRLFRTFAAANIFWTFCLYSATPSPSLDINLDLIAGEKPA